MFRFHSKAVIWNLVALMVVSPIWVSAQQGLAQGGAIRLDVSYIPPNAIIAIAAQPQRVLTSPDAVMLPTEVMSAAGKKELGVDPLDIVDILAVAEAPQAGPPGYGVVIRFSKPYRLDAITLPPDFPVVDAQLEGRPYRQSQNPMFPGFFMPDDRTLIIATDAFLRAMLANKKAPTEGPLVQLLSKTTTTADLFALGIVEPIRPMLSAQLEMAPLPPPFEGVKRLPNLIEALKIDVNVLGSQAASLVLLAPDDTAATELEKLINQYMDMGRQMALAQMQQQMQSDDPVELATAQYAQRVTTHMMEMFRPQRNGRMLRVTVDGAANGQVATIGILVALLLPAVQAAREAARRASSTNNLKQIAIAMHNHHDVYKKFPPRANFDQEGKPLLSWRVHILPFVGQQALYQQFHLDEPWDSPHNRQFLAQMPSVYRNPSSPAPQGKTDYLVPVGTGSIFENPAGASFRDIRDGTSNTILVLEVDPDAAVEWTKPVDLDFTADNPLMRLGKAHPGGFNAAIADGSIKFISISIDPQIFLRLLQMNDGQRVDIP